MGNEIAKKYDVAAEFTASGGHEKLWKCYAAQSKSTGQAVTLCVLKKDDPTIKKLERSKSEQLFEAMRKDVRFLQAQGHNRILRVIEVLGDNKKISAFVCERVVCSLANLLSGFDGISRHSLPEEVSRMRLTEVETARGIAHIAEALQYFHNVSRRIHMNVCPENIFITPQGHWKLGGFGFSLAMEADSRASPSPYFGRDPDPCVYRLEPNLSYAAPEMSDGSPGRVITTAVDLFSLGVCSYEAFQISETASSGSMRTQLHAQFIPVNGNRPSVHIQAVQNALQRASYEHVPMGFRNPLMGLLQIGATSRLDIVTILASPYFHTGAVALLRSIDDITEKPVAQQASFLTSLPDQLRMFEARILKRSVLPALCATCMQTPSLWQYTISSIEAITLSLDAVDLRKYVQPYLTKGLAVRTPEVMKAFANHSDFFLDRFDKSFFQSDFTPMMLAAIECADVAVQTLALKTFSADRPLAAVDNSALEQQLAPTVCKTCVHTDQSGVKTAGLVLLAKICPRLSANFLSKAVLPTLKAIRQADTSTGVAMCLLGCYDVICPIVGPEYVCNSVLPVLLTMLYDKSLNAKQFEMASNPPSSNLVVPFAPVHSPRSSGLDDEVKIPDRPPPLPPKDQSVMVTPTALPTFTNPPVPRSAPADPFPFANTAQLSSASSEIDDIFAGISVASRQAAPAFSASPMSSRAPVPSVPSQSAPSFDPFDPFSGLSLMPMTSTATSFEAVPPIPAAVFSTTPPPLMSAPTPELPPASMRQASSTRYTGPSIRPPPSTATAHPSTTDLFGGMAIASIQPATSNPAPASNPFAVFEASPSPSANQQRFAASTAASEITQAQTLEQQIWQTQSQIQLLQQTLGTQQLGQAQPFGHGVQPGTAPQQFDFGFGPASQTGFQSAHMSAIGAQVYTQPFGQTQPPQQTQGAMYTQQQHMPMQHQHRGWH